MPRAIVVDPAPNRGNTVGGTLHDLGYDVIHSPDGRDAFLQAAEHLNVSVILAEPTTLGRLGTWSARDLLTNLRADARTAGIPVLFYGPLGLDTRGMTYSSIETQNEQVTVSSGASRLHNPLGRLIGDTPATGFVPTPTDANAFRPILERELKRLGAAEPISGEAARGYALASAKALVRIGATPGSPFATSLPEAVPALLHATRSTPEVAAAAVQALGDIPGVEAQRRAADLLLDPSVDSGVGSAASLALAESLQRFGPLLTNDQEKALLSAADQASTPERRAELSRAIGALRPATGVSGSRLRAAPAEALLPPTPADHQP
jgi:CheY-like chemotaxis protein